MTDIQPTASTPDQDAAEYALGVTTADQRREAERRIASDPAFAGLVSAWDERFAPLIDAIPEKTPPRVVWMRIAAQLGLAPAQASGRPGVWSNIQIWRAATAVFGVAAAAAVVVLLAYPKTVVMPAQPQAPVQDASLTSVGLLKGEEGPASFVVTLDRANRRLTIAPVTGASPSDKSFEMWILPKGQNPISLGVMDGKDVVTIDTDKLIGPDGSRATLAVSVEPLGGSPTGLPTGPVVASGQLQPI
jgi:anti-sigma-K factor RskA